MFLRQYKHFCLLTQTFDGCVRNPAVLVMQEWGTMGYCKLLFHVRDSQVLLSWILLQNGGF
jgi:hypothetical protein